MGMDIDTLFFANAIILFVMALAFLSAWIGQRDAAYWPSWIFANLVLAIALLLFIFDERLPNAAIALGANALLTVGFGLRWKAARQFAGRRVHVWSVWGPAGAFAVLCAVPGFSAHPGAVYAAVNILLAVQATMVAYEFWRDRSDRLPSRYGLVVAYGAIALSFAGRVGQGVFFNGAITRYLPHDTMLEVHLLIALFHTVAAGAFALSIAYERGAIELREAALRDPMTGLYNRRAFEARVGEILAATPRREFAVVFLDIDRFRRINERYGHAGGDAALRSCAQTCAASLRQSDFMARIGGEEFAAILPDISASGAFEVTDRLRRAVAASEIASDGHRFGLTLSAGICHSSSGTSDFDALMRLADSRLYRAKNRGRNRVEQVAA